MRTPIKPALVLIKAPKDEQKLTASEMQLIRAYRRMDISFQQMLSGTAERAAESSEDMHAKPRPCLRTIRVKVVT